MIRIELSDEALEDIDEALSYYEEQSAELGARFVDQVELELYEIVRSPLRNIRVGKRYHARLCSIFPYRIVYALGETIRVVAVYHAKRNPSGLRKRLRKSREG